MNSVALMSIDVVIRSVDGLSRSELEQWIAHDWVRPDITNDTYHFAEIDLARIRLIRQLTTEFHINQEALPLVLSLLDQLYDLHRMLRHRGAGGNLSESI